MSVIAIKETTRRGSSHDESWARKYTRTFKVLTSSNLDGPLEVRLAVGIPRVYESYVGFGAGEADLTSWCRDVRVEAGEQPLSWDVTCEYSSIQRQDLLQIINDPLLRPPDITWGSAPYEREFVRDLLGRPVVNSATYAIDPPPVLEESRPVLTYARNELTFNENDTLLYQDAVNSDNWFGLEPRQAKMHARTAVRQFENGFSYYKVTYEFHFRRETFDRFLLDQGFRDVDGFPFLDRRSGLPLSSPTLLNGAGKSLRDAVSVLQGAIAGGVTTLQIANPNNFPEPDDHLVLSLRVEDEVVLIVSEGDPGVYTVVRGYAGTTPAAHADGVDVKLEPVFLRFLGHKQLPFAPLNIV